MVWGSICHNEKSELVLWDKHAWGNINAVSYQAHILFTLRDFHDFISRTVLPKTPNCFVMQDNAFFHKTKTTMAWFE